MSTTIIATIASILVTLLPHLGITVGSEQLTTTIQTVVVVISGIWIWYRRVAIGDISILGKRI
jgi:hypothetical protein